jgi:hypothetical protein
MLKVITVIGSREGLGVAAAACDSGFVVWLAAWLPGNDSRRPSRGRTVEIERRTQGF